MTIRVLVADDQAAVRAGLMLILGSACRHGPGGPRQAAIVACISQTRISAGSAAVTR